MDPQTIRAAAWELLHAHAAISPVVLGQTLGVSAAAVCGALGADQERFERVAGGGCWWWRMSSLAGYGPKHRRPDEVASDGGAAARAYRHQVAVRERIRGALQAHPGGTTLKRLIALTGLAGTEIADQLQGLRALGEATAFTIPGMAGFEFWKESAA
jgi:hypothetical protein